MVPVDTKWKLLPIITNLKKEYTEQDRKKEELEDKILTKFINFERHSRGYNIRVNALSEQQGEN